METAFNQQMQAISTGRGRIQYEAGRGAGPVANLVG